MIREGYVDCIGERRRACRVLVWKPEGMEPLRRQGRRREDIKIAHQETGWGLGLDCSGSEWRQVAGS